MGDLNSNQKDLVEKNLSAEIFKEAIGEIDKKINKFDSIITVIPEFGVGIGKENCIEFLSINDSCEPSHTTCAPQIPSPPPLSELPASLNKHVHAKGTWKRITRIEVGLDVVMSEAVAEKRNAGNTASQTESPKKRRVSQGGATKNTILAEAGY